MTNTSCLEVKCAEKDTSGNSSFALPQGAVTYTVSVNSRGYNSSFRASVLNRSEQNLFYSLSTTVSASAGSSAVIDRTGAQLASHPSASAKPTTPMTKNGFTFAGIDVS